MKTDQNKILATLPAESYKRLSPYFEEIKLPLGKHVYESQVPVKYTYFPVSGIVSLLLLLEDGGTGEIAVIGDEGIIGISGLLGGHASSSIQAVVQSPVTAIRLPLQLALSEFQSNKDFQYRILRYIQALFSQIAQTALCNRHHSLEQQLARWLLLSMDRLKGSEIIMTQVMIASMLGVRREGVNSAARKLQQKGIITYKRGQIKVIDREQLIETACECYTTINNEYNKLYSI